MGIQAASHRQGALTIFLLGFALSLPDPPTLVPPILFLCARACVCGCTKTSGGKKEVFFPLLWCFRLHLFFASVCCVVYDLLFPSPSSHSTDEREIETEATVLRLRGIDCEEDWQQEGAREQQRRQRWNERAQPAQEKKTSTI